MKMKRTVSMLLLTAMLASLFASCAGDDQANSKAQTTSADGVTTAADAETEINYLDMLPAADFGGQDCDILCRESLVDEIWIEEEIGETMNDAVYRRNKAVEEKYKVVITPVPTPGDWSTQSTFIDALRGSVQAQDGAYDISASYLAFTSTMATEGLFYNLYDIDTIDLSNVWWTQGFVENNTLNGRLYTTIGDVSLSMWESLFGIFFNKQLAVDYDIGDVYQTVKDGKWTLDTLQNMSKKVSGDINGDSEYTEDDLYGFITNQNNIRVFVTSCDIPFTKRNDEGSFDFIYYGDKVVTLYERMFSYLFDGNEVYIDWHSNNSKIFMADRALFATATLGSTETYRQMDTDFGILPYPKYDESQKNYISHSADNLSVFAIPASVTDPEFSGTILEALSAESKQTVIPAFYDIALKGKGTRDNDSEAMIDLIRDTVIFDFGYVHAVTINGLFQFFGDTLVTGSNPSLASVYEKKEKQFITAFDKVLEAYNKITE